MVSSTGGRSGGHEDAALDEIDLAGELMIAATASDGDRLPPERIDEVLLLDRPDGAAAADRPPEAGHRTPQERAPGRAGRRPGAGPAAGPGTGRQGSS
ncbi:hypothetical protein ACFWA9_10660 [Kitasatospora sp. NPDC059973]|uniref:hypothetical protein n=1 Tax=Kitasatospora sp. NPDC059973 TaxID=3347020 RepID=UPI0036C6455C